MSMLSLKEGERHRSAGGEVAGGAVANMLEGFAASAADQTDG